MYIRVSKIFSDNPSEKFGIELYDNILKPTFLKIFSKEDPMLIDQIVGILNYVNN